MGRRRQWPVEVVGLGPVGHGALPSQPRCTEPGRVWPPVVSLNGVQLTHV